MAAADPQVRIETLERALHWAQLTIQKKDAEIHELLERLRKQRIGFLGTVQRNAERSATGVVDRTRAFHHARGSGSGVRAVSRSPSRASRTKPPSGPQATARESAAHRRSDCLRC